MEIKLRKSGGNSIRRALYAQLRPWDSFLTVLGSYGRI